MRNTDISLGGNDPVSYQQPSGPQRGLATLTYEWGGQSWRFATEANLDTFKADPERYAPAYGGMCAFGVTVGKKLPGNPKSWTVVDDRLYLAKNGLIEALFAPNPKRVAKATERWAELAA